MRPQDGADKQDCETRAVKRWLKRVGPRCASLNPVYLGDDLHARQPTCEAILATGGSFVLVCKPSSHKTLAEYLRGVELGQCQRIEGKGSAKRVFRYRWINDVPIRDGDDALSVNWLELEISKPNGKVTGRHSFITNLPVNKDNVAEMAACGRARWKIENEAFNVLKNNGYNFEHNFGHGNKTLASILVVLNLIAYAMHNFCGVTEPLWQKVRQTLGPRYRLFEHIRTITAYHIFTSWRALMRTILTGVPPPLQRQS